jgi:hypothetical protein
MERTGSSLGTRALAVLVLAIAAWLLLKVVISVVAGLAWTVAAVVLVVGVFWALSVLRR